MDWVEQDTALRIKLNQARQAVARRWLDDEWRRARERFEVAIAELNKELFNHNLRVPLHPVAAFSPAAEQGI